MFACVYPMTSGIFLLLGTNQGDRIQNLMAARSAIAERIGKILQKSSIYKTAAWGNLDQPDFYNQVIEIDTLFEPLQLLKSILNIEEMQGRVRHKKWGPRVIDIDLLFYKDLIINEPLLTVPHPAIPDRRFTLAPLAEIAPDLLHPVLQKHIKTLLHACNDPLPVEKINVL